LASFTATTDVRHEDVDDVNESLQEEGEEKKPPVLTNLEANDATVDRPLRADLNSTSCVMAVLDYALQVRDAILNLEEDEDAEEDGEDAEFWLNTQPLMESYGIPIACDGSPAYATSVLKRKEEDKYKYILCFSGGFHLELEMHRKRGDIFGPTHLREIFSSWRKTNKQLDWVMSPGDPTQMSDELLLVILAQYTCAVRGLVETRIDQGGSLDVSAADVVDHMISRAQTSPLVLCNLLEIRFAEVVFAIHHAGHEKDAELYRTAMKFAAILCATTHATKYVSLISDFFVMWYGASEADKALFAETILTRETVNGRNIFTDQFVEWMMRDLRRWLGKHVTHANHQSFVERVACSLNHRKIARQLTTPKKSDELDENAKKTLEVNKVYCETLVFLTDLNFYGVGPVKHVPTGQASTRVVPDPPEPEDPTQFSSPSGKTALNLDVCFAYSIGLGRWKEYFVKYLLEGDLSDPSRSEIQLSLGLLNPEKSVQDQLHSKMVERCCTIDTKVIQNSYLATELQAEIKHLNNYVPPSDKQNVSGKKSVLSERIALLRQNIVSRDPNWLEQRKLTEQRKHAELCAAEQEAQSAKMINELESQFFTLAGAAKNFYADIKHHFVNLVAEQNNEFDNDHFTQPVDETATIASETSSVPTRGSYRSSQSVGASYLAQMQFTLLTPPDESAETLQFMPSTPPYEPPETLN
jgi:hypothetical protein